MFGCELTLKVYSWEKRETEKAQKLNQVIAYSVGKESAKESVHPAPVLTGRLWEATLDGASLSLGATGEDGQVPFGHNLSLGRIQRVHDPKGQEGFAREYQVDLEDTEKDSHQDQD